jgi:ribosomal protein S4
MALSRRSKKKYTFIRRNFGTDVFHVLQKHSTTALTDLNLKILNLITKSLLSLRTGFSLAEFAISRGALEKDLEIDDIQQILNETNNEIRNEIEWEEENVMVLHKIIVLTLCYPTLRKELLAKFQPIFVILALSQAILVFFAEFKQQHSVISNTYEETGFGNDLDIFFFNFMFEENLELNYIKQINSSRVFDFYFYMLERKYGFRMPEVPFRLDRTLPHYKTRRVNYKLKIMKIRRIIRKYYGNLKTKEIWHSHLRAKKGLNSLMAKNYFKTLEGRLDTFLVRLGFFENILQSRKFIKLGFFLVNGRPISTYKHALDYYDMFTVSFSFLKFFKLKLLKMWRNQNFIPNLQYMSFPNYLEFNLKFLMFCYIPLLVDLYKVPHVFNFIPEMAFNTGRFVIY